MVHTLTHTHTQSHVHTHSNTFCCSIGPEFPNESESDKGGVSDHVHHFTVLVTNYADSIHLTKNGGDTM